MARIVVQEGESLEEALRRFNKEVQAAQILSVARRKSFYEKPSELRQRRRAAWLRKLRRQLRKEKERENRMFLL